VALGDNALAAQPSAALPLCAGAARILSREEITMIDDVAGLRRILMQNRTIAVVGLSANWYRPSYFAAKYMIEHGYTVIPVNPAYAEVLGQKCYPSLREVPQQVDIVDCFRRAEDIPVIAEEAIAIGAKVLWLQIGVINPEAVRRAEGAGLEVVMDRCVKIEYARLFGGLNWFGVNTGIVSARRPPHAGLPGAGH
jgi:predicted CoA-binding protein